MRIWKFPIDMNDPVMVNMPVGAEILSVEEQDNKACIWAIVDPNADREPREFKVVPTGIDIYHPRADQIDFKFIGTFKLAGGRFIGHLFEVVPK